MYVRFHVCFSHFGNETLRVVFCHPLFYRTHRARDDCSMVRRSARESLATVDACPHQSVTIVAAASAAAANITAASSARINGWASYITSTKHGSTSANSASARYVDFNQCLNEYFGRGQ